MHSHIAYATTKTKKGHEEQEKLYYAHLELKTTFLNEVSVSLKETKGRGLVNIKVQLEIIFGYIRRAAISKLSDKEI